GDEVVTALAAIALLRHQASIEQNAQMLRDGRPAHLEVARDRIDRAIFLSKEIEHLPPRGMANGPEDVRFAIGNHHEPNIRKTSLTRQGRNRSGRFEPADSVGDSPPAMRWDLSR